MTRHCIKPQLEKQLLKDGPGSIFKSLKSTEKILNKHIEKLGELKYKSHVESEINTFKKQLETIKKFIDEKGLSKK